MQRTFQATISKPSSWLPPYIDDNLEESKYPLEFSLQKDWQGDTYHYVCRSCMSAGGEIDDIFRTSSAEEKEWPYGEEGVPIRLAHEMFTHSRQHEIMWRWALNRIPTPACDK
jgi:hypothetical protein